MINAHSDTPKTAIYWDFENIHLSVASLLDRKTQLYKPVDPLVRLDLIMEYVVGYGAIAVNRAYGNWQWYGKYANRMLQQSIQLVQLFPAGRNAKNGADIRMAVDILDDLQRFPSIGTVVIVSGDVDFAPVAQRIRQAGLNVIGIGTANASNRFWINSCNEFKQYSNLLPVRELGGRGDDRSLSTAKSSDPSRLLVAAINNVQRFRGTDWVGLVDIRPAMLRLDSSFDHAAYGEEKFINFVRRYDDIVELRQEGPTLPMVRLKPQALELAASPRRDAQSRPIRAEEILQDNFRPFDIQHLSRVAECLVTLAQADSPLIDARQAKASISPCLPEGQVDGYYDLLRRTFVFSQGEEGLYVPEELSDVRAIREQVLAGLLGYLDEATSDSITEEEFAEVLGQGEDMLEEIARLPSLAELPVPIQHFPRAAFRADAAIRGALSLPERIVRRQGIYLPTLQQLEEVCDFLALAAQEQQRFADAHEVVRALSALEYVNRRDAERIYKNVYTAHCFNLDAQGMTVNQNLLRPEAVRKQVLGRLLAYIDFQAEEPVDRKAFALMFGNDDELVDEMLDLPPESMLPVRIVRRQLNG